MAEPPNGELDRQADAFCEASIRDGSGRAARMLAANPDLAGHGFATAVILGDAGRVRAEIAADPGLATRADPRSGWTPLHAACASQWHRLDPARADGLLEVVRILLDAGADPNESTGGQGGHGGWTPLRCAVAGASNPPVTRLLLERGAVPGDHDLYLAAFSGDHECLRLLLGSTTDVAGIARMALAAPISLDNLEGVRLLLEAGADPRRYDDDAREPAPAAYAAVRRGCSAGLIDLLLAYGAEPDLPGPDGRSPLTLATVEGREDLAGVLLRHGATDDTTDADRFLAASLRADSGAVQRQLALDPGLPGRLTDAQRGAALVGAAQAGDVAAIGLMLDLGFPVNARGGEDGGTALHAAAYAGSAEAVRLLLERGADIEVRDASWDSTPLDWGAVGSGYRPDTSQDPDWTAVVQTLLDAGASTEGITLSPDNVKQPSPAVVALLRRHGVPSQAGS